jgi:hypothetical protein
MNFADQGRASITNGPPQAPVHERVALPRITTLPHFRHIKCWPLGETVSVPSPHQGHLSPGLRTWPVLSIVLELNSVEGPTLLASLGPSDRIWPPSTRTATWYSSSDSHPSLNHFCGGLSPIDFVMQTARTFHSAQIIAREALVPGGGHAPLAALVGSLPSAHKC